MPGDLAHRSIYVKGELHLGPLNECRHCRPTRRTLMSKPNGQQPMSKLAAEAQQRAQQRLELEHRFTHHAPKGDQVDRYRQIRRTALEFAELLVELCPLSREQSVAFTRLEEVVMFANAAIAREVELEVVEGPIEVGAMPTAEAIADAADALGLDSGDLAAAVAVRAGANDVTDPGGDER